MLIQNQCLWGKHNCRDDPKRHWEYRAAAMWFNLNIAELNQSPAETDYCWSRQPAPGVGEDRAERQMAIFRLHIMAWSTWSKTAGSKVLLVGKTSTLAGSTFL